MRHELQWLKLPVAVLPLCLAANLSAQAIAPSTTATRDAEIRELHRQLDRIAARLTALEADEHRETPTTESASSAAPAMTNPSPISSSANAPAETPATAPAAAAPVLTAEDAPTLAFLRETTINVGIDGYYGYNFNAPLGRVNLLRAYDVTSNSFNLNQASIVLEHLPSSESRFGGRLDLQFGQATDTLQGSSANEQRPQVWRNVFQAYGSYLAPIGSGLQLDFGKFSSSLGNEGNYTKDQIAYSRAYSFNYLPFYHMGLRANYNVSSKLNVAYWLVNGVNNTEDTNGFKSQAFLLTLKQTPTLSWNINYYFGQEARDVQPTLNPGLPTSPAPPGLPTSNISPAPNGREHIFDTYATWNATPKLTVIGEADYVLNRTVSEQQPARVVIGSLMAKYSLPRSVNVGARAEYFDDRGGLFSGTTQALKEGTVVLDRTFTTTATGGFLARAEFRRDWSNQNFFLSDTAGALKPAQSTATLGLVYWWGTKQGSW